MIKDIQTFENDLTNGVIIRYTPLFSAFCSVGNAPFNGVIEITYVPNNRILEFESFEWWIKEQSKFYTTIEQYASKVFNTLSEVLEPKSLAVTVKAETIVHGYVEVYVEKNN